MNVDEKPSLKTGVCLAIAKIVKERHLTQKEAANFLKISQPRVSLILREKSNDFTLDKLIEIAVRAGLEVDLDIKLAA